MDLTKQFHISDILSVTAERNVSTRDVEGLYDVISFVCGDPNISIVGMLIQSDRAKNILLEQFPQLRDADGDFPNLSDKTKSETEALYRAWVRKKAEEFGEYFDVKPSEVPVAIIPEEEIDHVKMLNPSVKSLTIYPANED